MQLHTLHLFCFVLFFSFLVLGSVSTVPFFKFKIPNMSEPWDAQSWAASDWQQSSWDDPATQWYDPEHRYGYDSRQSTMSQNPGDAELPPHFKSSRNYLDETLVYRSTLQRYIEPSAWSRAKGIAGKPVQDVKLTDQTHKGIQEWMIRGLSHGKFTGVVLTKSIAESVLTAGLLSALREKEVDIEETVEAMRKDKSKKAIPDKTSEATKFIQPLVDVVMQQLQPFLVTVDQTTAAASSGDNKEFQDMQQDNAKLRQKLQQAGIPITPMKNKSAKRRAESTASSPEENVDNDDQEQPLPVQEPIVKKRKTTNQGKNKADLLDEPTDVLSDNLPNNVNNTKSWVAAIRKDLSSSKQKQFDSHVNKMLQVIDGKKYKKDQLQTLATRWGLPFSMANTATPKFLQNIIAVATWHSL